MTILNLAELERLTDLVTEASGGDVCFGAPITFQRTVKDGRAYVHARVEIFGTETIVSAGGFDHCSALVALLSNIRQHHRDRIEWEQRRHDRVLAIINERHQR